MLSQTMPSIPPSETTRGLLTSWLLVVLPATSGFLVFFVGGRPPHKTIWNAIAVGLFWALVTTLVVGTALFGVIRAGQLLGKQDVTWAERFLLGRDRRESGRWLLGVGVLSALLFLALAVQSPERIAIYEHRVTRNGGIGSGTLLTLTGAFSLLAMVHGYRNDGLLVGWALVGLPMLALLLFGRAFPLDPRAGIQLPQFAILASFALGTGAVGGTTGSLVGSGIRRVMAIQPVSQHRF